jgi:hypothetical protein
MPTGASGVAGAPVHQQLLRPAMLDAYSAVVNESPAFAASPTERRDALADGALESGAGLVDDPDAAATPADAAVAPRMVLGAGGRGGSGGGVTAAPVRWCVSSRPGTGSGSRG